jgi:hypothetical protein
MMMIFWIVTPCRLAGRYQRFREAYCLHRHCWRWRQHVSPNCWYLPASPHGITTQKITIAVFTGPTHSCISTSRAGYSSFWWWRHYALLKRRSSPTRLHGAVSQKVLIFIIYIIIYNPWRYSSDEPWPAEQPPLAVFSDCTRRYWVDMWSAHRIPQLHFQLSKPDRYFFIQVTT